MGMTYGEIRYLLTKQLPGVDPDLIDAWIGNRYVRICDRLAWTRLHVETVIQTVAAYQAGTAAVVQGSATVNLTGGAWTSPMTGRAFRVATRGEYYEFTYASPTQATLDRPYEGETDAAAAYLVYQAVYTLPADARFLDGEPTLAETGRPIARLQRGQLARLATGVPQACAAYMDSATDPPVMQIELSPAPDDVYGILVPYTAEKTAPNDTAQTLLPWLRPDALMSGVLADGQKHLKDVNMAMVHERDFETRVAEMAADESRRRGSVPLQAADWITRYRLAALSRSLRNPRRLT